jgi:hypothetical protein
MPSRPETLRTNLAWYEALLGLVAAVIGYGADRSPGLALLCGLATGIAFGVWRVVRFQGKLLQLEQARYFDETDEVV